MKNKLIWVAIAAGTVFLIVEAIVQRDLVIALCACLGIAICFHELKQRVLDGD